jgi:hypothetical protein
MPPPGFLSKKSSLGGEGRGEESEEESEREERENLYW